MKFLNVFTKREFKKDGEVKSQWYRVGYLKFSENGGIYLRLFQYPNTEFFVMEPEDNKVPDIQVED